MNRVEIGRYHILNAHPEYFVFFRCEPDHLRRIPWKQETTIRTGDKVVGALAAVGLVAFVLLF
ncbi:MAG: hypothetical protein ACREBC_38435 [Pyrinomonadaceae bacterium]